MVWDTIYWPYHGVAQIFMRFTFLFSNWKDIYSSIYKNNFYFEIPVKFLMTTSYFWDTLKTFHFEVKIIYPVL